MPSGRLVGHSLPGLPSLLARLRDELLDELQADAPDAVVTGLEVGHLGG